MKWIIIAALLGMFLATAAEAQTTQTVTFSLTWQDNSANEDGFDVLRCTGGICNNFVRIGGTAPNVATYSDAIPGDTGNLTYRYQVKAFNKAGASAPSNTVSITSPAIIVIPGVPTGLIGSILGVTFP